MRKSWRPDGIRVSWNRFLLHTAGWYAITGPHEFGTSLSRFHSLDLVRHDICSTAEERALHWAYMAFGFWWAKSLLNIAWNSISLLRGLVPNYVINFHNVPFLFCITILNLSILDGHRCPISWVVLINLKLSTRAHSMQHRSDSLPGLWCHIMQTQLRLLLEPSVVIVNAYLGCNVYRILLLSL